MEAGRHDSYDKPPQGSFFKAQGRKSSGKPATPEKAGPSTPNSLTPVRAAGLRSTLLYPTNQRITHLNGSGCYS